MGVAALDGTGALGLVAVTVAATAGLVVASSWLLLSVLLDLLAGEWPGRRRLAWTVAVTLATFVAPAFLLAALTAAT